MRPEKFLCLVLLITITDAPNLRSQAIGSDRPTPAIFGFPIALGGNLPAPFGCNDLDLAEGHNTARNDPSWAPIIVIRACRSQPVPRQVCLRAMSRVHRREKNPMLRPRVKSLKRIRRGVIILMTSRSK